MVRALLHERLHALSDGAIEKLELVRLRLTPPTCLTSTCAAASCPHRASSGQSRRSSTSTATKPITSKNTPAPAICRMVTWPRAGPRAQGRRRRSRARVTGGMRLRMVPRQRGQSPPRLGAANRSPDWARGGVYVLAPSAPLPRVQPAARCGHAVSRRRGDRGSVRRRRAAGWPRARGTRAAHRGLAGWRRRGRCVGGDLDARPRGDQGPAHGRRGHARTPDSRGRGARARRSARDAGAARPGRARGRPPLPAARPRRR